MKNELAVGQKVVHPRYGAGTVVRVRKGHTSEGHEKYYVIDIPSQELQVHLPVGDAQEEILRQPVSMSKMNQALDILRSEPAGLPKDYRERHALIVGSIQSGAVTSLAQVIRDLHALQSKKTLSIPESNLLIKAKRQLAGELAIVADVDMAEAMQRIESALLKTS